MVIRSFPPVQESDPDGLLAIGGDLEVDSLLLAYKSGIFPWPISKDFPLTWFSPPKRAVLFLKDFHASKSLLRLYNKKTVTFKIDTAFKEVVSKCGKKRRGKRGGTWVTPLLIDSYVEFHEAGYCHSIECFEGSTLVGGLFGTSIGRMFAAESMYFDKPNSSKLCICYLVEYLRAREVPWIDLQVLNPFTKTIGGVEIDRAEFLKLLQKEVNSPLKLF